MRIKILALALLSFASMEAQEKENFEKVKKNTIKTNVTGYLFRNANLTYERSINKRFAINISYGHVSRGDIPVVKNWLGDEFNNEIQNLEVSSNAFTIEPRVYFGKKYNSGFYLAPYYRYTNFNIHHFLYQLELTATVSGQTYSEVVDVNMSGELKANSFGLMIGAQWLLGKNKNWVLDWWIGGGHYGSTSGNLTGVVANGRLLNEYEQQLLQDNLVDVVKDIPIMDIEATATETGVKAKLSGPWLGLRSGVSFGYRF